ncbi:MAG: DUF2970 domain-containing protein [Pseudomonadota bacterium]|jgi:preprotein translocase subunit Sec61beta
MAGHPEERRAPGPLAVIKAVLWSFFGIRRRDDYNRDAVSLKPHHVVIAGVVAAVLLVATLVLIVRFVVSQ